MKESKNNQRNKLISRKEKKIKRKELNNIKQINVNLISNIQIMEATQTYIFIYLLTLF